MRFMLSCFVLCVTWTTAASAEQEAAAATVRLIEIDGSYADYSGGTDVDPIGSILGGGGRNRSLALLCSTLRSIATKKEFEAVFFDMSGTVGMNAAQASEFKRHIEKLKAAGIRTVALIKMATTSVYTIAAHCDRVLLASHGDLDFHSPSVNALYVKDALDLLGVEVDTVRAGDFKAAVEPFMRSSMSEHLRAHYVEMITSINDTWLSEIERGRGLKREDLRRLQSRRFIDGDEAKEAGLVDEVVPFGTERRRVETWIGGDVRWVLPKPPAAKDMSFFEMMNLLTGRRATARSDKECLAVLYLNGMISDGKSRMPGMMVSGPTIETIRKIKDDALVKGVVVRIDSPGGSVSASIEIRAALLELAAEKPVIVSMGSTAASGGYWISCLGRPVYAEATTITGSIGVFGMKPSLGPLMERLGVKVEYAELDRASSAMNVDRGWTESERRTLQKRVDKVYREFITLVAEQRNSDATTIEQSAGGRVFTGAQALKHDLVDELGGLEAAIAALKAACKIEGKIQVWRFPQVDSAVNLIELLRQPGDYVTSPDSLSALRLLAQSGYDLRPYLLMLQWSLTHRRPWVMALCPSQFVIE